MKKIIVGYEIEIDCKPYKNWIAFRTQKEAIEAVKREMLSFGYKNENITISPIYPLNSYKS
jgi:hypothetical protein